MSVDRELAPDAVSTGLSFYLALAGSYDSTYGTLGGVVITLLFFYTASLVFIFGAELNAAYRPLAKKEAPQQTEASQPLPGT